MKTQILQCKTYAQAYAKAPWAAKIRKVESVFVAYESVDEYKTAKKQK